MAKTSRDAWRHYGAILDFFSMVEEVVSGEVFEEFICLRKEQKYLRQSFRRLLARGFIKKERGGWRLTKEGLRFSRRRLKPASSRAAGMWDGKWRLVSFDVPVDRNDARDALRALLVEFDFFPLQKSVWVSPFAAEEEFIELVRGRDLWRYCKLMMVDILEGDETLREKFKLPPR